MTVRRVIYLFLASATLFLISACSNYTNYERTRDAEMPTRRPVLERRVSRRSITRPVRPVTRSTPAHSAPIPAPEPVMPHRVRPHASAQAPTPEVQSSCATSYDCNYTGNPYDSPVVPPYSHTPPQTRTRGARVVAPPSQPTPAQSTPAPRRGVADVNNPTVNNNATPISQPVSAKRELSSHKTEFNAKEDSRSTNIAKASNSINGHTVQPGATFSYNETVGPTVERRGYKEGTIFVQGEKKKGFGGGVCQVSSTLSVAAEEAGMTILERHDHSRPVSYAKEGEEAATSYGGIDFKFKNEKPFPVVIKSTVEGGTITIAIYEG